MAAVLAVGLVGCDNSDSSDSAGPANFPGAGGSAGSEGSFNDSGGLGGAGGSESPDVVNVPSGVAENPLDDLFADQERNPEDFLGLSTDAVGGAQGYAEAALGCYASPDACGDAECGAFASCCVNTGACCAPVVDNPPLPATLDFRQCAGESVAACAADSGSNATAFGDLEPVLNARGFVPNGTATAEGGAIIGDPVNLASQRVELEVQFAFPIGCGGTCLESAGVAFTATEPSEFVDADVGLLLSGSREQVNVMIGNQVADSFFAAPGSTQWRLVLSPDGSAEVFRDDVLQGRYAFDAAALTQARLVVFGRNLSDPADSAAIAAIQVDVAYCDNPRGWSGRQPVSVSDGAGEVPGHGLGAGPSIADLGSSTHVAYEVDGEIFVAEQVAPGALLLDGPTPALFPTEPYEAMGLHDPELVSAGSSVFLFYTARDENGRGSIGRAESDQSLAVFTKGQAPLALPGGGSVTYDAPSVVYRDGFWLMVVRATLPSSATELRVFYANDPGTDWARVVDGTLEQLTGVESPTSEVTEPSLVIHNSAYQLYYARRSGTRWSVELLVSDELLIWRSMGDVLGGSSEAFDSLGARSPDVISGPDRLDIVYAGQDGVAFQLGTASRTAPSNSAPSIF